MGKTERATAQEKGLGSKVRLGLYIFSTWKAKGLLGFGSKTPVNGCVLKVSMVFSLWCYWEVGQFVREESLVGGIKAGQGAFEWDIKAYHHHPTLPYCFFAILS